MTRHMESKHETSWIVSSLVEDLVSSLLSTKESSADVVIGEDVGRVNVEAEERDISPYERIRNERVAALRAEFNQLYPNFENEVRALKVVKTRRRRRIEDPVPTRRSSRIHQASDMDVDEMEELEKFEEVELPDTGLDGAAKPSGMMDEAEGPSEHFVQLIDEAGGNQGYPVAAKFACLPCEMPFR